MASSRYVVGIDLGTTHCALAYVDTSRGDEAAITQFPIPQVVAPGEVAERTLLPSFIYLPGPGEQPTGALRLPWAPERDFAVGEFARQFGSQVPTRLVSSAKSWLCHPGVDRRAPILPWKAPDSTRHVSPLQASRLFLSHLVDAWNAKVGELILVADVGGGTTDFTLIEVGEENGSLALTRLAVGEHILLGGDNMDLTLAHTAAGHLAKRGVKLDSGQMLLLSHSSRRAK